MCCTVYSLEMYDLLKAKKMNVNDQILSTLVWPESDKSACMYPCVCVLHNCVQLYRMRTPACHENQDYLNLVDVVRLDNSCTIKETGFLVT